MRFHTKEEHEELLRTVISEHRTRKRIQELKVWDMDGIKLLEALYIRDFNGCSI